MDPFRILLAGFVFLCLSPLPNSHKDFMTMQRATGPFEVKIAPLDPAFKFNENLIGRFSLDKQFHGDLEATSQGEMLSAGSPKTSGGYVAIERVSGTLASRSGTFILQHNATMTDGVPQMNIIVVPGTGTGQLTGLTGTMAIIIKDGKHSYDLAYTLPDSK
jgi:Protein of unknown function (DUF3224)